MRFFTATFCLLALVSLTGCGATKDESARNRVAKAPVAASPETAMAQSAVLPQMFIARVPLDATGKEIDDQVETRQVLSGEKFEAAQDAERFFNQGSSVAVANELDEDSSSQQWHRDHRGSWYWNTPWYPGRALGRGVWWGRNPWLNYGGYNYPYNYYNNYDCCSGYNVCHRYYTYYPSYYGY
jgi:hypothetical protein